MAPRKRGRPPGRRAAGPPRPEVFRFHDYRAFLKEWISYRKAMEKRFSLRMLSKEAGMASGFLPMILAGQRELSESMADRLSPALGLEENEVSYFKLLVRLGANSRPEDRVRALNEMKRFSAYQRLNPKELEVHQYLTHWYYVAIREMVILPGFRPDPTWIQERLQYRISLQEIQKALDFLLENGFLKRRQDGSIEPPDKPLDCISGIYKIALSQFHREMLSLASRAIEDSTSDERLLLSHTVALTESEFLEVRKVVEETVERIKKAASRSKDAERVYQCELTLFPLSRKEQKS